MPIQLTQAFDPGDLEHGVTYAQVKIVRFVVDLIHSTITIISQYGNTVDGVWVPAKAKQEQTYGIGNTPAISVEGEPDYVPADNAFNDIAMSAVPQGASTVHDVIEQALYQKLLDDGVFPGVLC